MTNRRRAPCKSVDMAVMRMDNVGIVVEGPLRRPWTSFVNSALNSKVKAWSGSGPDGSLVSATSVSRLP